MNVERDATANAVAAYFVYFFSIILFGFFLTGSINRPRRQSDRANQFCGISSGHATHFSISQYPYSNGKNISCRFARIAFNIDAQIISPFFGSDEP
jgi:hypothetical protein